MIHIYKILFSILFVILLPILFLFPRIRETFFERIYLKRHPTSGRESIWFHGASAGDILSIRPIIDMYYQRYRDRFDILITSNTTSGRDIVKRYFPSDIIFRYMPFDIPIFIRNFLSIYRPRMLFVEAAEFWPVLIHYASKKGVRILLVNGNIKRERVFVYRLLSILSSNPFKKYDLIIVRNDESMESAIQLGVDKSRLIICTNTKYKNVFDMKSAEIPERLRVRFKDIGRLIVFGSIHYEEEDSIIQVIKELLSKDIEIRILVAPRHMERIEPLMKRLKSETKNIDRGNLIVARFSEDKREANIIVLDTIGDLFYIYSFSTVAFVGGSLRDMGGHNILEPAIWGVPTITGRFVKNYEDIVRILLGFGLIVVEDTNTLSGLLYDIIMDNNKRERLSNSLLERLSLIREEFSSVDEILERGFGL